MGGKLFWDTVVLGTIRMLQVTSDPNGSISAPRGSVAYKTDGSAKYRNTSSGTTGTTWVAV